jgi:hypothetical protein
MPINLVKYSFITILNLFYSKKEIYYKEKKLSKKKIIENLNIHVDDINEILEKIKILSANKNKNQDEFLKILEEEIIISMHEINEILIYIESSLEDLK